MVFIKRFSRALIAVGLPLTTHVALAGYTFEDGDLKGEVNLTAGARRYRPAASTSAAAGSMRATVKMAAPRSTGKSST